MTVLDIDVIDIANGIEGDNLYTILGFLTGDILDVDVADGRYESTTANLLGLVVEINLQDTLLADTYFDIAGIDVLNHSATAGISLDAYHTFQLRRVHDIVFGIDITASARNL